MNIKSITVLPSTKGYLAVTDNDIFAPEYIVLAVVEDNDKIGLMPLAIRDLITLNEVKDGKEFGKMPNDAVTSTLVQSISLRTAAMYIVCENKLNMDIEVAGLKLELTKMANAAEVKFDDRINDIHTIDDCEKILNRYNL